MRKSQRIPSTKQTKNLYGILYYTNNTGRKTGNKCVLQENQAYQTRTSSKEELENRNNGQSPTRSQITVIYGTTSRHTPTIPILSGEGEIWNVEVKPTQN